MAGRGSIVRLKFTAIVNRNEIAALIHKLLYRVNFKSHANFVHDFSGVAPSTSSRYLADTFVNPWSEHLASETRSQSVKL